MNSKLLSRCILCSLFLGGMAFADTTQTTTMEVDMQSPPFSITRTTAATTSFNAVTLTGVQQDYTLNYAGAAPAFTIQNAGSSAGWSVTLQIGGLTAGSNTLNLAYGGSGTVSPSYTSSAASSTTDTTATQAELTAGKKVISADAVAGNGQEFTYTLGDTWTLKSVPAATPDALYSGTLTVTATQAP